MSGKRERKLTAILLALLLTVACHVSAPAVAQQLDWDPDRTWFFCVGLLEWQYSDIWSSFPDCQPDRRDEQLVKYFQAAGVPDEQITYLQDAEATKSRIQQQFVELLDSTGDGDLLIFYFCGHGYRNVDTETTWFANFDAGEKDESAWSVPSIFDTIEAHFSGDRALMLADCCHSGAMFDEARQRGDDQIAYAVLTSSYSHNLSTGNWTFSDSLLAGLRGEPTVDLNDDDVIALDELARYTELEMAFIEGQKSMFTAAATFPRRAQLAVVDDSADEEADPRVGQRIEAWDQNKWYRAKVIDADGDQLQVHYVGFDDKWDAWVGPDRVRPYRPGQFAEGDKVDVCWSDDKWYPARVLKAWYGIHLVRYDDEDASSDEWVGPKSIRLRTE
jgi:hypothetical protein